MKSTPGYTTYFGSTNHFHTRIMNINRVFQYSIVIINFDPFGDTSYRRKQNIKLGMVDPVPVLALLNSVFTKKGAK